MHVIGVRESYLAIYNNLFWVAYEVMIRVNIMSKDYMYDLDLPDRLYCILLFYILTYCSNMCYQYRPCCRLWLCG